jgi:glyoxylase-like metal-dependent hydrolase (beta-lactamase superfamily II)
MNERNAKPSLPGVVRRTIGDIQITALLDGYMEVTPDLFSAPRDQAALAAREQFQSAPHFSPVNCFLVQIGGRTVLIDAGAADLFVPTLGNMPSAMAAAGYRPEDVDVVLLTHMHPDHFGGAIAPDGSAAFPNAELFVSQNEYEFWADEPRMLAAPDDAKPVFAGAKALVNAYRDRIARFAPAAGLFGGLTAVPLPGHTPGHTGFILNGGSDSLFIWADTVHHAAFQMKHPEWGPKYDIDPELAIKSRKKALEMAASDRMLVAGMHLPFPAFGHVTRETVGYRYVPADWPYAG